MPLSGEANANAQFRVDCLDVSMRHLYAEGHPEVDDCIGKGQSGGGSD